MVEIHTSVDGLHSLRTEPGKTNGLPAVLVHGFSASAEAWRPTLQSLGDRRAMLAPDMPGHGDRPAPLRDGTVACMVEALHELVEARLGGQRFHLAGTSWGGAIVADYARAFPGDVASLALVAPVGLCSPVVPATIESALGAPTREGIRARMRAVFADEKWITDERVEDAYRRRDDPGAQQALATISPHLLAAPLSNLPPAIAARTWLCWGDRDEVVPCPTPAVAQALAAEVTIYPGCGHIPQIEREADFHWRLATFWSRHDPRPATG